MNTNINITTAEDLINFVNDPECFSQINEKLINEVTRETIEVLPEEFPGDFPERNTLVVDAYFKLLSFFTVEWGFQVKECTKHEPENKYTSFLIEDAEGYKYDLSISVKGKEIAVLFTDENQITQATFMMEMKENKYIETAYRISPDNLSDAVRSICNVFGMTLDEINAIYNEDNEIVGFFTEE